MGKLGVVSVTMKQQPVSTDVQAKMVNKRGQGLTIVRQHR